MALARALADSAVSSTATRADFEREPRRVEAQAAASTFLEAAAARAQGERVRVESP